MLYRICTILVIPFIVAMVLGAFASTPRTTIILGNERWTATYTGLDWFEGQNIFGRQYYEFAVDDLPQRTWLIKYRGGDYADAVARYPDGKIALSGRCRVERKHSKVYPLIDDLSDAVSYNPKGTIVSRVANGSGKAVLFHPNGNKDWEVTYDRFIRTHWVRFDEDGKLVSSSNDSDSGR